MSITILPCGCMNQCIDLCTVCKKHADPDNEVEFEGGNNAELSMIFKMCDDHYKEYEADEWAFRDKYAENIDNGCYERLIDHAEALRDETKYK